MTNNNTDQERFWQQEFEKNWNMGDLRRLGDSYHSHVTNMMWEVYLDLRQSSQVEIGLLKNEMQCHIKAGVEYSKLIDSRDNEIQKLREHLAKKQSDIDSCGEKIKLLSDIAIERGLQRDNALNEVKELKLEAEDDGIRIYDSEKETQKLREQLKLNLSNEGVTSLIEQRDRLNEKNDELENEIQELKLELQKERECVDFISTLEAYEEFPATRIAKASKVCIETIKNRKVL